MKPFLITDSIVTKTISVSEKYSNAKIILHLFSKFAVQEEIELNPIKSL